jgi:hypothetical protein
LSSGSAAQLLERRPAQELIPRRAGQQRLELAGIVTRSVTSPLLSIHNEENDVAPLQPAILGYVKRNLWAIY